jgi:peptidoglycan/LPS O-acetylase OafA/YrhL
MQFYIVFPLLVAGFTKYGIRIVLPMIALSVLYRMIVSWLLRDPMSTAAVLFNITFLGRWMEFAAGMWAAWIVGRRIGSTRGRGAANGMLAVAIALYALGVSEVVTAITSVPLRELLLSAAFGILCIGLCTAPSLLRRLFECRPMLFLGLISYSVYLLHQNVVWYFSEGLKKFALLGDVFRFALLCTVGLAFIVGVSYLFFRAFEKPFLKNRRMR